MNETTFANLARRDSERHLLVAVDESENSRRTVMYVADFFGNDHDVFITLLSIVPEPSEDYFPSEAERRKWMDDKNNSMQAILAGYKEVLLGGGFQDKQIEIRLSIRPCVSIADVILEEQEKLRCCIVVVGRRGITHAEEFVFGSTSSKILHHAKHCAVMVIE